MIKEKYIEIVNDKNKYNIILKFYNKVLIKTNNYNSSNNSNSINNITNSSNNSINNSIKLYIKKVKYNNKQVLLLRNQRKNIRDDLEDLERAYCGSGMSTSELVGQGKNTGGKPNNVAIRQIEKLQLKEQLGKLLTETLLLEKSLNETNKLIENIFDLIPRYQYGQVLKLTYIDCLSNTEIAIKLNYSTKFVDAARIRGIEDVCQLVKYALLKQENSLIWAVFFKCQINNIKQW